jgi:transposase-like protein
MTSRTKHHAAGQNHREETRALPSALQRRRQEALERYLAGDPIAVICREIGCAKSWLYKWKNRYQATEPEWFQEHSRRPETTPTKTPDALGAEIVRLRHTLVPDGSGTVSAGVIRDHLRQRRVESLPSRRTIYRILNRQAKEVNSHSFPS